MPKKQQKFLDLDEVKMFTQNIPEDRQIVANGLFSRLEYLSSLLAKLEKQLDKDIDPSLLKGYNDTLQRYGIICKQLVGMLPKATEDLSNDPLMKFVKDGYK